MAMRKIAQGLRKIAVRDIPHRLDLYFLGMRKTVTEATHEIDKIVKQFQSYAKHEDTKDDFRLATRDLPYSLNELEALSSRLDKLVDKIDHTIHAMEVGMGTRRSVKDFLDWLSEEHNLRVLHGLTGYPAEELKDNLDYYEKDPGWDLGPKFVKEYRRIVALAHVVADRIERAKEPLENLLKGEPKVRDTEILYHASVNAVQLAQMGFLDKRPEDNYGLGGSSQNKEDANSISFTYSEKFANDIARWLKEMAMIAQGHLKPAQILQWADMEGSSDSLYDMMKGLVPLTKGSTMDDAGYTSLVREGGKWKVINQKFDPKQNKLVSSRGDLNDIFQGTDSTYALFQAFIATHPLREQILVIGPSAVMRRMREGGIDPKNIGVIAAEVDMTDPAIHHLAGEREFRVPPRAVRRVVKLVGG